jgi:3-hydroxyacyl-[acyl-carrier-protein] dehydratase
MDGLTALDDILTMEPGKTATAIRNIPSTLAIFDSHFPRFPVLPGVLLLGSLARLGMTLLETETGKAWRLATAEGIKFRHFAQPGDRLELQVDVSLASTEEVTMSGTVRADGRAITTARRLTFVPTRA